ncbi:MAG: MFS transporter [Boseongicola sp.]
MTKLIQNRSYRLLFSATAISNLGDGVSALALPWLATLITRDPTLIALVAFATRLPWFLFAIPAGAIVDRGDRRQLIVQADIIRTALTAGIIALIFAIPSFPPGHSEATFIFVLATLAFLLGSAEVISDNSAQTLLPSVVEKQDLETANGQLWSVEQIMGSFVGPPLAGVLIALAVPAPFLLDAVTFALAAWLAWAIAVPPRAKPAKRALLTEIGEGWRWMRSHPMVLRVAIILGLLNGAAFMSLTVLVLVSQEVLHLSAFGHGILLTAGAAGGVVGGLLGPKIVSQLGSVNSVRLALVIFPIPYLVIGMTNSPIIVGIALFFEMLAALIWNIVTVSWRQRIIPDAILGRVNSLYRFFGWGLMPFGALIGGLIVSLAEPEFGREFALRLPYIAASAACVLLAVFGWRSIRL